MKTLQKGFTLLELLIVIAILAVLATVAVLVINPTEYLKQARDSQRINDLGALKGALDLYLTSATSPTLGACPTVAGSAARCTFAGGASPFASPNNGACGTNIGTAVTGTTTSWVDVNLTLTTGGSPLPKLPVDPTNSTTYFYAYACNNTAATYELDAKLESAKFATDQNLDAEDGGNQAAWYEVGTALTY